MKIRPWATGDLPLLHRLLSDPQMMVHLGGPESPTTIAKRHERYCRLSEHGKGRMFVVTMDGADLGSVGYWDRLWQDHEVWELGWSVLPEYQGRGVATKATILAIEHARNNGAHRFAHAFPSKDNEPSNAICLRIGFERRGIVQFEYPADHFMECVDWRFDLFPKKARRWERSRRGRTLINSFPHVLRRRL